MLFILMSFVAMLLTPVPPVPAAQPASQEPDAPVASQPGKKNAREAGSKVTELLREFETEIEELKLKRNEMEELKRSLSKAQHEAQQLREEKSHLETDSAAQLAQRDEQLQKLRDIHAALDKQYTTLETSHKDLDARFQDAEQKNAALADQVAKIQEALTVTQEHASKEITTLQQQGQETQNRLTLELDQTRAKHQQAAKELEALHNTQLELQERLVAAQEKGVNLDAAMGEAQKARAGLDGELKERNLQLEEARKQAQDLQQALDSMKGDLTATGQSLADIQKDRANLQEQLRVAKDTQTTFNEQLKELQTIKVERDKLQLDLNEREAEATKFQGNVGSLSRDLETAKRQLQTMEAEGQESAEQMRIDNKGLEWRVESLEKELQDARTAETRLQVELEGRTKGGSEQERLKDQIAKKLSDRESQLKQAESVIKLLQGSPAPQDTPPVSYEPVPDVGSPSLSAGRPEAGDVSVSAEQVTGPEGPVKIYQVNEELNFVVFSMEGMAWAKPGTRLLLVSQNQPVVAVQLTELDSAGFAVAQIIQTIDSGRQIRKGDLLFARPLLSPVGQ